MKRFTVYQFRTASGEALYTGCTSNLFSRLQHHWSQQPWIGETSSITVEWFERWEEAAIREAELIKLHLPKYNRRVIDPTNAAGMNEPLRDHRFNEDGSRRLNGDGIHCCRCGAVKERRQNAWCAACHRADAAEKRAAAGMTPSLSPTCPRCMGPKPMRPKYCSPCRKIVDKELQRAKNHRHWRKYHPE